MFLYLKEDVFYAGLGIVKVAADGAYAHVFSGLGYHLRLLHGADAVFGIEYDDPGARHVAKAFQGGLARVAAGGGEDQYFIVAAAFFHAGPHQMGQQAQGHVLKGAGGAAEELQHGVLAHGDRGGQIGGFKFIAIGGADQGRHLFQGKIRQQCGHDHRAHVQRIQGQRRLIIKTCVCEGGQGIQAAVRGDALHDGLGRGSGQKGRAGALIDFSGAHCHISHKSSKFFYAKYCVFS